MSPVFHISQSNDENGIRQCFAVMQQLRPHLTEQEFVEQVKRQIAQGYQLCYLKNLNNKIATVAGFRLQESLVRGNILYVDDLVTDENQRSNGSGHILMAWLKDYAKSQLCRYLELDSGVQRQLAHRFYFKEEMAISSFHFIFKL